MGDLQQIKKITLKNVEIHTIYRYLDNKDSPNYTNTLVYFYNHRFKYKWFLGGDAV